MSGLQDLLVLQERDTEIDQLRHRRAHLPEQAALDAVVAEQRSIESSGASATAARDELLQRQAALEADISEARKRRGEIDQRMRSGVVGAARDLQAMAGQIESLDRRVSDLEDQELLVMEEIEPLDAQIDALQARWGELEASAGPLRSSAETASEEVGAALAAASAARDSAAAAIPQALLAQYERLRARLGGVGAAPLVGASCGGCHLTLSASELDRIKRLPVDEVVTCEQCGRILVR